MPQKRNANSANKFNNSNRFSSLASSNTTSNSNFKKKSEKSKDNLKSPENSRFKNLETKKNIFSQAKPRENSRWRRDGDDKTSQNEIIHRKGDRKWGRERRPPNRRDGYRKRSVNSRLNKFTNKLPAFNVAKENFPSLGNKTGNSDSIETNTQTEQDDNSTKMISHTLDY